jgi:LPXTG-motif cell wall-anchored protein
MSVEFMLRNLNDGDETIAIFGAFFSSVPPPPVPGPPTLVLVGIAFAGLAGFAVRSRRQSKS